MHPLKTASRWLVAAAVFSAWGADVQQPVTVGFSGRPNQPAEHPAETDHATGWSPGYNSRAVPTAAKNHADATPETEPGAPAPTRIAQRFGCLVEGLIDYDAEVIGTHGSVRQSDTQHVDVGESAAGGADRVGFTPDSIVAGQDATVTSVPVGGPLSGAARA